MGYVQSLKDHIHDATHHPKGYEYSRLEKVGVALYAPLGKVVKMYEECENSYLAKLALTVAGVFAIAIALVGAILKKAGAYCNDGIKLQPPLNKHAILEQHAIFEQLVPKMEQFCQRFKDFYIQTASLGLNLSQAKGQEISLEDSLQSAFDLLTICFRKIRRPGPNGVPVVTLAMLISLTDKSHKQLMQTLRDIGGNNSAFIESSEQYEQHFTEIIELTMSWFESLCPNIRETVERLGSDVYNCLMKPAGDPTPDGGKGVNSVAQECANHLLELRDIELGGVKEHFLKMPSLQPR